MRRPKLVVTVAFEPGRVGVHSLIDAYACLVPTFRRRIVKNAAAPAQGPRLMTWTYRRVKR